MNLAERYTDEERAAAINEWLKNVNSIESKTISLSDENDPLTELDRENYTIVKYKDGTEKRDLSSRDVPSVMCKHIDSIMQSWGLKIQSIDLKDNKSITWNGLCYVRIEINQFHNNMFNLKMQTALGIFCHDSWETYHPATIESIIEDHFIKFSESSKKVDLIREIKIRSLTR